MKTYTREAAIRFKNTTQLSPAWEIDIRLDSLLVKTPWVAIRIREGETAEQARISTSAVFDQASVGTLQWLESYARSLAEVRSIMVGIHCAIVTGPDPTEG